MNEIPNKRVGYPVAKWNPEFIKRVKMLMILGATDNVLAAAFGVNVHTIHYWKKAHPDFLEEYNNGKVKMLSEVAMALVQRAIGYEYDEEEVHVVRGEVQRIVVKKHVKADSWAAAKILHLKAREFGWCDTTNTNGSLTQNNVNINNFDLTKLSDTQLEAMKKLGIAHIEKESMDIDDAQIERDGGE